MDNIEHRYQKNKNQDFNHTETNKEKKRVARNHQPLINNKKKKKKNPATRKDMSKYRNFN